jgi:hypothetical protein
VTGHVVGYLVALVAEGDGLSGGDDSSGSSVCAGECSVEAVERSILFNDVNDVANLADAGASILGLGILALRVLNLCVLGWGILGLGIRGWRILGWRSRGKKKKDGRCETCEATLLRH